MYRNIVWIVLMCVVLTGCGRPEVYNMCTPSYASLPLQRGSDVSFQKLIAQKNSTLGKRDITVLKNAQEAELFIRDVLKVDKPPLTVDQRTPIVEALRQIDYTQSVAIVAALGITPFGFRLDIQRVDWDSRVLRLQAKVLDCPESNGALPALGFEPMEIISIHRSNLPSAPFDIELISNQQIIVKKTVSAL
ncbi:MAG: hypothetical protein MUD01_15200 [Chloroflexaceae bacterium]|jgi:hypothetical protein|nr:hypothetical protein [Chloroflexaceae bacterium]